MHFSNRMYCKNYILLSTSKSNYMINHLETVEQVRAWNSVGKEMSSRWKNGMALGVVLFTVFL